VIGLRLNWRRWLAAVAAIGCAVIASVAPAPAADVDPASMSADAIKALEQRLTDAGCYHGALDGKTSSALVDAIKACPDQRPFLRIETGMHTAQIRRIGVDAACSLLATASDDKTVRLWSLPDGRLKRVLRLPIGDGNAGRVFATALSPDGRWLAAGGWDAAWDKTKNDSLTLVDLSNGAIRRLGGFENVITSLAFSTDGRRVAVALSGNNGVRVLDSATGAELLADRDYGADAYGLAFAPDGALIASSFDGQLRRYGPDLKLTVKRAAPDGKLPTGVAIDPSGRRVAVGYNDGTPVSILAAKTLAPIAKAQNDDLTTPGLSSVAWSRDGATLVAGGRAGQPRSILRRFDAAGGRKGEDIAASADTVFDIQPCGDGFAFAGGGPAAFGLLSAQGVAKTLQDPHTADMRDKRGSAFALTPDAASVRFGLGDREQKPVLFDLAAATLTDSASLPSGFLTAKVDGLPVTDWEENYEPKFNGAKLALENGEMSRALAIRPDGSGFALGASYLVHAFDAQGKERWRQWGPSEAFGVDFSSDGAILAVAYDDGTIRWLRWSDGAELLALFVEPQSRKWVAWTPSGYYMASAGGEDLIGWHVNRGWNQEADFFPASQFRAEYNRPDIVKLVLQTKDEADAIRQANVTAQREVAKPIAAALPPVVTIASPADGFHPSGTLVQIDYSLRSPSGQAVDRLDVLADGRPVEAVGFEETSGTEAKGHVVAEVPKTSATLSLIAYSGPLTSAPVSVKLARDRPMARLVGSPNAPTAPDTRPKLVALLVGVRGYQNPKYDTLKFPDRDAQDFAAALEAQKGLDNGLYADVETKVVDAPNRANVIDGLYWLQHEATSRDIAVVFLSGHGIKDTRQKFWFLTRDADLSRLLLTAISNDDLAEILAGIPAKKVLFIDACHAGALQVAGLKGAEDLKPDMNKLVDDFATAGSGLVVYAASTGSELAHEDEADRHGAFAEALIEAIGEGKAESDTDGGITIDRLDDFLVKRVEELTGGEQHPVMNRNLIPDFPLAVAHR
jgi:WD40 repeat protein